MFKTVLAGSVAALMLIAAPAAYAADMVLALDRSRLIAQTAAGKSIQTQLQAISKTVEAELTPEAKGLETELESIQKAGQGLTMEQLQGRNDLKTRVESLNKRKAAFDQKRGKRTQELIATQNKADVDFEKAAQPILEKIIKDRGASLVVDVREVVFVDPKIDITQDAIAKMDAAVKTIAVTKVNLPDKPAGQQ
ncbi:MAG: OmpH family outer membrane protein [Caulobacterales bacterium]